MKKITSKQKAMCSIRAMNKRRPLGENDTEKKRRRKQEKEKIARAIKRVTRQLSPDEEGEA